MAGQFIPKRMSLEEAENLSTNFAVPIDTDQLELIGADELGEQQLDHVLNNLRADLREADAQPEESDTHNPDAAEWPLRADEEIEGDLAMLTSHEALLHTAQARHAATLRLIDDLLVARGLLTDLQEVLDKIGLSR